MAPTKRINDLQTIVLKKFTIAKLFCFFHTLFPFHHIKTVFYGVFQIVSHCISRCVPPFISSSISLFYYRPQQSCEGYVFTGVCLSTGWGLPQCILGYTKLGRHSPWTETPPTPEDGYCCGRYSSYWNAFLLYISCFVSRSISHSTLYMHVLCHAVFYVLFYAPFHVLFYALFHVLFHVLFHAVFQVHHVTPGQQISAKAGDFVAVYKAQTGSAKLWIRTHQSEYCECTHICTHTHTHTHTQTQRTHESEYCECTHTHTLAHTHTEPTSLSTVYTHNTH